MKKPYHSLGGKTGWANRTKKEKTEHIDRMNKARTKAMRQNKEDAEKYRRLVLQQYNIKND